MLLLDAFFRFTGMGCLLILAICVQRDFRSWRSRPYLLAACLSVGALFLGYAPELLQPTGLFLLVVRFADIPHLICVWLFALSLFEKDFRLQLWHIIVGILYCAPIVWFRLNDFNFAAAPPDGLLIYGSLTSIALMGHLCLATLRGRADDMLEPRRASRVYFVVVIVAVSVMTAIIDPIPADRAWVNPRSAKIMSIWPAIVWGTLWLLRFDRRAASFGHRPKPERALAPREAALKDKLTVLMNEDEIFRQSDLTIVKLAHSLGVTQHALRWLINQGLGYSNFSDYLNTLRIEAVKRAMAEPETSDLPVLTLAMDSGFASLSTFNAAFKQRVGLTPSAYRAQLRG